MHYAQEYLFRRLFIDKIDRLFKQRIGANYMSLYDTFGWMQTIDFREEMKKSSRPYTIVVEGNIGSGKVCCTISIVDNLDLLFATVSGLSKR